jgi:hypothetical protein
MVVLPAGVIVAVGRGRTVTVWEVLIELPLPPQP